MGPADPFSDPERARRTAQEQGAPRSSRGTALGAGFAAGALFGLLVLLFGVGPALLVLLLGALGAAVGWVAHGFTSGAFDLRAAWRALRRR